MAYGTKYRFIFDSLAGTSFRIDIQKDGYSGSIIQRALGQAPHLRRDSAQNGICGTSLEIYAECTTDGEFAELYTTNARGYKAMLQMYVSGSWSTIWTGFVSPELYSEPEIAPPYDVCITAVDGLGELKMYDFPANGRQSLRTHLQTILAYTGLDIYATDIISVSSLRGTSPTIAAATMLANTYVNLDHLSDGNCYEALQAIMQTLHMTITRYNNKWLLIRDSDVAVSGGSIAARDASGTSVSLPVAQYKSMTLGNWWPVGQMETEIVPAKKQVIVGYPYRVAESLFTNPETANPYCGVQPPPINVDDCPGWSSIGAVKSYDGGSAFYGNHALIGKLQQTITVEPQGSYSAPDQMQLVLKLAGIGLVSGPNSAKIKVKVFVSTGSSTGPWLKKKRYGDGETDVEWVTTDSYFELTVPVGYYSGPPDLSYTEFPIILPYVPGGNLTIQLDGSEAGNNIRFSVGGAYLTKPTINGYQDVINIDNSARDSEEDIELSFGDSPYTANALASVLNIMSDGSDNLTTEWATAQFTGEFLSVIAMDYALGVALPRLTARGTINVPKDSVVPAAFLNPDGIPMLFNTWDWNLFDDEVDVNMTSIPAAEVTIDTETITQLTDEQAAAYTGGTGGGTGGGGGYPAPTPGQNFFEAVEENTEVIGARAIYDLYIDQDPEEDNPVRKNITEILRHLSLRVVTPQDADPFTVLVSDITIASEKNVVAGGVGDGSGGTGGGSLASLADVTLTSPAVGDTLVFDSTNHWVNTPLNLNALADVEVGTPANGQALLWNATLGKWVPGTVQGSGSGGTGGISVVGLTMPTGFTVTGSPLTTDGTIQVSMATGYAIPTTAQLAYWTLSSNTLVTTRNVQIGANGTGNSRNLYVWGQMILHGATEFYADLIPVGNVNIGSSTNPWLAIYGTTVYEGGQSLADKYQAKLPSGTTNGQVLTWNGSAWVAGNAGGGGEVNVIESISVNGTAQTVDANKNVNITVPTALSQLSADATHRLVTDTEKSTWNAKQSALPNGTTNGQVLTWNGSAWVAGNSGGGGDVNVIESISVNGTNVAPDSNKNVGLTIGAGVLTIKMNNASVGTFSANATGAATIDLGTVITSLSGYATQSWVEGKGYITSSALSGYATQTWVENKGYITSSALSGYATQTWVQQQGYLTAHQSLGLFAGQASGTSNYETSDPYIILTGGGTNKGAVQLKGAGTVTVSSDANGVVTITGSGSGPGTIPAADANTLGGIRLGYTSQNARHFALAVDENNRAYVSVPDTVVSVPDTVPTIGTSETTLGTVGGVTIKAKIAAYLLSADFTAANIVSTLGTTAVNRATADASGNTITSSYLRKDTNDTMAGNLAIGTSSSSKKLTIYGTTSAALTIYGSTYSTNIYRDSSSLQVSGAVSLGGATSIGGNTSIAGTLAVGTTSSAKTATFCGGTSSSSPAVTIKGGSSSTNVVSLYITSEVLNFTKGIKVTGNISATGNVMAGVSSDRRLKKDIRSISLSEAADLLSVLNPVVFQWNEKAAELGELHGVASGFIADEYLDLLPNAGRKIWGEYDAIDYNQVIPYLVAGWQQQNLRIRILEGEIRVLKEENQRLNRRMRDVV